MAARGYAELEFPPFASSVALTDTPPNKMFGLDEWIANLSDNAIVFVAVLSIFLGLRHATDPDHLSAMLTLRLSRSQKSPHRLGVAWGVGHAITMLIVGVPLILLVAELPSNLQQGLEFAVGLMIVALALQAIWQATKISSHTHEHAHHDHPPHSHPHTHGSGEHSHRSERGALAMGILHGAGGSAGVVALLLSRLNDPVASIAALVVISIFSGVSMAFCSWLMCRGLDRSSYVIGQKPIALIGGGLTLLFGMWYAAAAFELVPYPL